MNTLAVGILLLDVLFGEVLEDMFGPRRSRIVGGMWGYAATSIALMASCNEVE